MKFAPHQARVPSVHRVNNNQGDHVYFNVPAAIKGIPIQLEYVNHAAVLLTARYAHLVVFAAHAFLAITGTQHYNNALHAVQQLLTASYAQMQLTARSVQRDNT